MGRSGSGKNYFAEQTGLDPVISYTTRPKRPGEVEGVEHYFVDDKFYQEFSKHYIVAYTHFNGYHYWASMKECNEKQVYIIDPAGVRYLKSTHPEIQVVVWYLDVPVETCIEHMRKRGDSNEDIKKRALHDESAFRGAKSLADVVLTWNK